MIKISPSLLSADFGKMAEAVKNLKLWGSDYAHCDVMDGVFVPNITFGMPMVAALKKYAEIPLDVHLMIINPEKYVGEFVDAGADIVTFHPDASHDVLGALKVIKSKGARCGLVLNPDKPLSLVEPYINEIDMILIMGVYAGFGGQKFIPETLAKLAAAKKLIERSGRNIELEIDGGVTESNIGEILAAGADVIVAGSAVFKSADPAKTVASLRG
ncbi:MAG: ribulose-phosphate 3-epimerase [Christensenellales bacterium]|jgi:ribulose-phosphate 3-epimerase|nr:ribulose-phosphate 3-epimerase [Clostridia bacterium]HRU84554.1 ribulose-phosphate 3-epimerase [Eubacteriales bacterium]